MSGLLGIIYATLVRVRFFWKFFEGERKGKLPRRTHHFLTAVVAAVSAAASK